MNYDFTKIDKEFDEKFGSDGPEHDSDSIGRLAGCDDCWENIRLRAEHKQFLHQKLSEAVKEKEQEIKDLIKLEAEIDLTKEPNETRVKSIDDPWMDFGYWLEVLGFMAHQAMKYREWSKERTIEYAKDYLERAMDDYKIKLTNQNKE